MCAWHCQFGKVGTGMVTARAHTSRCTAGPFFGQDGGTSCLPAKGRSEPGRWRAAAWFAAAPGQGPSRAAREGYWPGLMSSLAEASWSSGSDPKGAEQVRRRRANFGHDPRLTACREVARTHQGLHGGHPGDHHAALPVSCVSASSTMSATECFDGQVHTWVHTTSAEGAPEVSPSTLQKVQTNVCTSPRLTARSATCFQEN